MQEARAMAQPNTAEKPKAEQAPSKGNGEAHQPDPSFLDAQRRARGEVKLTQVHLAGDGYSWRGLRVRDLPPTIRKSAEKNAIKEAGERATIMELHDRIVDECIRLMVVQVTVDPVEDLSAEGIRWEHHSLATLSQPGVWDRLFTAKDDTWLRRRYQERHETSPTELGMITGKAIPVTTGA
jgi:hypothetical protein